MAIEARQAAEQVMRALNGAGFEAYLVGGCVRDLVLGREPKDYDVTTSARPEQVIPLFEKTVSTGASFGVVTVVLDGVNTEVATYRSDGNYADGRHPDIVFYSDTAEQDVSRRDFTINGLLMSYRGSSPPPLGLVLSEAAPGSPAQTSSFTINPMPDGAIVVDYVGGLDDIRNKTIRCIGNPTYRFTEDALRMLRACRFAAQLGFRVSVETSLAIDRNAALIRKVSVERITAELLRIVTSPHPDLGLALLASTGLLDYLPVKDAVKPSLANAMRRLSSFPTTDPDLGMAMLLAGADPCETDHGHLCKEVLKLSSEHSSAIAGALEVRMALLVSGPSLHDPENHSRFRLKRLMRTPGAMNGVALARQDVLLRRKDEEEGEEAELAKQYRERAARRYLDVFDYCMSLTPGDIRPERLVTGDDLIAMGMEPGRGFRIILDAVEDLQLEGRVATRGEALEAAGRMRGAVEASTGSGPNPCGEAVPEKG
jgi:tRNA nucleotidyltransferase/poly(A) polymerase